MRVLHLISSGGLYGAEAMILDLSRGLQRSGHSSDLALFQNSTQTNSELRQRALAQGVTTHALPWSRQLDPAVPASIRALVRSAGAQVLHAHGYKADVYALAALRGSQTALVSTCHNWIDSSRALRLYGYLDRRALRRFQRVVAVSEGVEARLRSSGISDSRVRLIWNGVDMRPLTGKQPLAPGSPAPPPTIGVAARLSFEKGVDVFLRAAALVHEHVPEARFLIAGDGPDRHSLVTLTQHLQLSGCVQLLGRQENMPGFYGSLDILVLPSRMEGLPMALLEGMASGLPVVATDVGAMPDLVRAGETGTVVPAGDAPRLAAALLNLLQDPPRRHALGARGRALIQDKYSVERMTADYLDVYRDALAEVQA